MINRRIRVTTRTKRPLRVFICLLLMVSLMASAAPLFASPANSGTSGAETATEDAGGRVDWWSRDNPILRAGGEIYWPWVTDGFALNVLAEPPGTAWHITEGATVTVRVPVRTIPRGYRFGGWETTPSVELSGTENPLEVRFVMPEENLTIGPIFEPAVPAENYREVTVVNGHLVSGGITTEIGSVVTVRGDQLIIPPRYRRLWVPSVPVEFLGNPFQSSERLWTAQFIMPDTDVTLTHVVEPIPPELIHYLTIIKGYCQVHGVIFKRGIMEYGTWKHVVNPNPPEGYRFVRWDWCTPVEYHIPHEHGKTIAFLVPDRDITLTPVFEPGEGDIIDPIDPYHREVTITGGTVTGGSIHEIGSEVEVIAQAPGPDYQFIGWEIESPLEVIATDNPLVLRFIMPDTDINIKAVFERVGEVVDIMVGFDLNGGTFNGSSEPITVDVPYGTIITLPNVPLATRLHYELAGWQVDGTGQVFTRAQVAQMNVTSPVTFVALWIIHDYFVVFDLNGGTVDGSTANVERLVNHGETLGAAVPVLDERSDANFLGWRNPETGAIYISEEVAALEITAPIAFVAVWDTEAAPIHSIIFNLAGGVVSGDSSNVTVMVESGSRLSLGNVPTPAHPNGYAFLGWRLNDTGNLLTATYISNMVVMEPLTFVAQWDIPAEPVEDVEVWFDLNHGNINGNTEDIRILRASGAIIGVDAVPAAPQRDNHTFLGWQLDGIGAILNREEVGAMEVNGLMIFSAAWERHRHPVIFQMSQMEGLANVHLSIEHGERVGVYHIPATHQAGYVFRGWRLNGEGELLTNAQVAATDIVGPTTFTAFWESTGNNNQPGGNLTPGAGGGGNNQTPGAGGGNNQPPATGGNNQPPATGGGTGPSAPQTGDESLIGLWLILAILSLVSVVKVLGVLAYNKKRLVKTPKIMFDNELW